MHIVRPAHNAFSMRHTTRGAKSTWTEYRSSMTNPFSDQTIKHTYASVVSMHSCRLQQWQMPTRMLKCGERQWWLGVGSQDLKVMCILQLTLGCCSSKLSASYIHQKLDCWNEGMEKSTETRENYLWWEEIQVDTHCYIPPIFLFSTFWYVASWNR